MTEDTISHDEAIDDLKVSGAVTATEEDRLRNRSILTDAYGITRGPRRKAYGHPRQGFTRTANLWSALLGAKLMEALTPEDVGLMMICLKVSREQNRHSRDNLVDIAGYAQTAAWVAGDEKVETSHD